MALAIDLLAPPQPSPSAAPRTPPGSSASPNRPGTPSARPRRAHPNSPPPAPRARPGPPSHRRRRLQGRLRAGDDTAPDAGIAYAPVRHPPRAVPHRTNGLTVGRPLGQWAPLPLFGPPRSADGPAALASTPVPIIQAPALSWSWNRGSAGRDSTGSLRAPQGSQPEPTRPPQAVSSRIAARYSSTRDPPGVRDGIRPHPVPRRTPVRGEDLGGRSPRAHGGRPAHPRQLTSANALADP